MATIYDVAREAGVSPKTVSRVLNGDAPVGQKTRETVRAAIDTLGYVPSPAARTMRTQRSGLIGLITGAISLPSQDPEPKGLPDLFIVQGVQKVIGASPMTLMIADTGGQRDAVPGLIETFRSHRVEGLIYVAEHHCQIDLPELLPNDKIVLANCFDPAGTPAIVPDDRQGQRRLVARIIQSGHRRIGYLTLRNDLVATDERTEGYRLALKEAGIPFDPDLVLCGETIDGETRRFSNEIDRLLSLDEPPSVICCGNDKMAIKAYGVLRARGLSIPEDISIAGFDNYRLIAETLYPPLTTAELPYLDIGQRAAQRLLAMIEGRTSAPAIERLCGPVEWRTSVRPVST